MQHFSRQQLLARWDETPDILREAAFSDVNESILDDIAIEFRFSDSQRADTAYLCLLVFLGFVSYRNVMQELQDEFRLDPTTALALYQEIDAKLFEPIRKEIEDNYLKFKVGVVNEASVQKPDVASEINLKTAQPEGMVNLKKEDAGPKILAVGESGNSGAYTSPAPRPSIQQQAASSFGPSIIQKKQDVESAARPAVAPVPPSPQRDIFSLSTKDRWGIENENIITSRRMMGQPQVPLAQPPLKSQTLVSSSVPTDKNIHAPAMEKKEDLFPALEEDRLPEIVPEASRSMVSRSVKPEEKKSIPPPPAAPLQKVVPPSVSPSPTVSVSHPQEAVVNQDAVKPSPVINPTISVNVQIAPQSVSPQGSVAPQQFVAPAPAFSPAPAPSIAAEPVQAPSQPVRPMQWAAPAQPPKQPDVVVEIRQMQGGQTAAADGAQSVKTTESQPTPVRPMKVSPLVQSAPPAAPKGREETLAMHPISPSPRQPEIKKPLDPNEVVDIGPVIIHKRDDPSVAQMRSGAQYRDLSSGGFSRNFSEQSPHQNATPSVADIQVPAASGNAHAVGVSIDAHDQSPAAGYGKPAAGPAPAPKRGFFSFFKK